MQMRGDWALCRVNKCVKFQARGAATKASATYCALSPTGERAARSFNKEKWVRGDSREAAACRESPHPEEYVRQFVMPSPPLGRGRIKQERRVSLTAPSTNSPR